MKKIELEIIAISHSITQTQSYAVVLGEINGVRRLPIVIGSFEAQAIAIAIERMNPVRPLTHDLLKNFMNAFNIDLSEIVINDLQEGIFFSKLVCTSANDTIEIDSRTSDALALAVRMGCPIFTYESIFEKANQSATELPEVEVNDTEDNQEEDTTQADDLKSLTLEELQSLLDEVLEHEDYLKAIAIRDEMKRRESI